MTRVRSGSHLERVGETWYYQRQVPPDARAAFGKNKVRVSLRTTSRVEAERLEKPHDTIFEATLKAARDARDPQIRLEHNVSQILDHLIDGKTDDQGQQQSLDARVQAALAEIPEVDRTAAREEFAKVGTFYLAKHALLQRLIGKLHPIVTLTPATIDQWDDEIEPGIIKAVQTYMRSMQTEYTFDWAYEKWKAAEDRPEQSQEDGRKYLDEFVNHATLSTVSEVRRPHVTAWRDSLKKTKLAPPSINKRLRIVTAILRTGWRDAEITAPDLEKITVPEEDSTRGAWEREQLLVAMAKLEPKSWAPWVFVINLTTGTRLAEPLLVRKEHYDSLGFINVPRGGRDADGRRQGTKQHKYHVLPIINLIRDPLAKHVAGVAEGDYIFDAPRPSNPKARISRNASQWFSEFKKRNGITRVIHELRDTWIEEARRSPIQKQIYDIITGHAAATSSDKYGGAKPQTLLAANEQICGTFIDDEIAAAIAHLVG